VVTIIVHRQYVRLTVAGSATLAIVRQRGQ